MKTRLLSTANKLCLLGTATAFALVGCNASGATQHTPAQTKLTIATSSYPLSFLVEKIGGPFVDLQELPTARYSAGRADISDSDIATADIVFYLRGQYPDLDSLLANRETQAIDLSHAVEVLPRDKSGLTPDHDRYDRDLRDRDDRDHDDDRYDNDHDDRDDDRYDNGDDHDNGDDNGDPGFIYVPSNADPNFWSDPERMTTASKKIADILSHQDPSHANDFHANAELLEGRLDALDKKYEQLLHKNKCETNSFAVTHDSFGYLAYEYGLHQVLVTELDPSKTPSERDLARAKTLFQREGINTVFAPTPANSQANRELVSATDAQYAVLEEPTSQQRDSNDYLSIMEKNLISLATSMRCAK